MILLLGSSIVSAISATELTAVTNSLQSQTFRSFEFYFVATGIYPGDGAVREGACSRLYWLVFMRGRETRDDADLRLARVPLLLAALRWTLLLSLVAFVGGGHRRLPDRDGAHQPRACPCAGSTGLYIQIFQGTPVLIQLFIVYYGLAVLFDLQDRGLVGGGARLHRYAAAFLGDIWRGAIQAIPRQQWEAAECLTLTYPAQLRLRHPAAGVADRHPADGRLPGAAHQGHLDRRRSSASSS